MKCEICKNELYGGEDEMYHLFIHGTDVFRFCENCGWKVYEAINALKEAP